MPETDNIKPEEEKLVGRDALKVDLYFWLQALVMALVTLILVFSFVGRIISVDGSSMLPTLHHGDMLLLQSIAYRPEPGDVVVLTKKSFMAQPIVKRVIATGGQTVDIDYTSSTVFVDGTAMDEPYINEMMTALPPDYTTHITVPQGSIFVMGDNRNNSSDSRQPSVGTVDTRCVLGKALFVLFPISDFGTIASISQAQ